MSEESSTGKFPTFFYGGGKKFVKGIGCFGTLITTNKVFDGEFKNGKLDGIGCERTVNPQTNLLMNDFIGSFRNGKKHGEGRCFLEDGVYEGDWHRNQRSGCGMMWYKNGELYAGEWKNDKYHGAGVLVKENGNRFEGFFKSGKKHGEGTFHHCQTGQIQKGIWVEDSCKCSMMQDDETRFRAAQPTPYPIPQVKIENPSKIVADSFHSILEASSQNS